MNRRMMLYIVCVIMRIEAVVMIPALIIALCQHEAASVRAFVITIAALAGTSFVTKISPPKSTALSGRDGFFIVAVAWIIVSVYGCLPFFLSGAIPNFMDAVFETVSGFTTTGATILTDVEVMPMGLLYWRSFTHWLGGMGVLVLLLAIMPFARQTGSTINLLRAESPGPTVDKLVPRVGASAKILYGIYIGLTVLQFILLLAGGMSPFDSITTAYGTAGTGGFAVLNSSIAGYSPYLQTVVTVFMVIFGVNFNLFYLVIIKEYVRVLKSTEIWTYLGLFFASVLLITFNVMPMMGNNFGETFHHAAFQVASVMTTTGFATVDFNLWPQFSKTILITMMFCGACAGSTGGGIKTARVILLAKSFVRDLRRLAWPRSVAKVRVGGQVVDEEVVRGTQGYLTAYIFVFGISVLLVSINNFSSETTFTSVVACLNNIGPGLDMVGPVGNYSAFSLFSKLILTADMLIGRLELFPVLMIFTPALYKS